MITIVLISIGITFLTSTYILDKKKNKLNRLDTKTKEERMKLAYKIENRKKLE